VDTVISAVGQYSDTKLLASVPGLVDEKGNLAGDLMTGITPAAGVFAAGDLLTGTDIAIRAVAGGKHAARAVLAYLEGRTYSRPKEFLSKKSDFKEPVSSDFADTVRASRGKPAVMSAESRRRNFAEIETTLTQAAAVKEAARCLECGCQDVRDCDLKRHATEYDAEAKRFAGEIPVHPVDNSHPLIARDPSKCVLCGRCVRVCLEVQGIGVFGYIHRGFSSIVAPSFGVALGDDTSCISCGQCVSACPVGALTEKLPAAKTVPLLERVEEGTCTRCSVGCAIEYRWHGSLFTRITERYEAPNHGKLCRKGKFGHDFLNDAEPAPVNMEAAKEAASKMLEGAKAPLMRISPYLSAEAIDAFVTAARRKRIAVVAAGLERLDTRWADLEPANPAGQNPAGQPGAAGTPGLRILVGDIAASNNVAFTESMRLRKLGLRDLWIVGHDDETARRAASRILPAAGSLGSALSEALSAGTPVEVMVNPEEAPAGALESLLAVKGRARILLLWNSRNAGYLFNLARGSSAPKKPDLLLDVGVDAAANGAPRISWGRVRGGEELFIPLARELWTRGRSYPTGMAGVQAGAISPDALAPASVIS